MAASLAWPLASSRSSGAVEVLRDRRALAALVPAWEELAARALEPNPFYEHWTVLPALEAFAPQAELCFLAVRLHGTLAGLFPFEWTRRYKGAPVRALSSWRHRHMLLGTPLVRADLARECLAVLFEELSTPIVEFRHIPAGGAFERLLRERAAPFVVSEYSRALLRKNGAATPRRTLRQAEKGLRRLGCLSSVALEPGDDAGTWIGDFLQLEASGWKGRRGSALACKPHDRRFAEALFTEAHRRGRLIGIGLDLDGRAITRHLSLRAGRGAYVYKIAYDERYAKYSPGVLTELETIRHFETLAELEWMDSFTGPDNATFRALWKDRLSIRTLAFGLRARGRLALGALKALRYLRRKSGAAAMPCSTAEKP